MIYHFWNDLFQLNVTPIIDISGFSLDIKSMIWAIFLKSLSADWNARHRNPICIEDYFKIVVLNIQVKYTDFSFWNSRADLLMHARNVYAASESVWLLTVLRGNLRSTYYGIENGILNCFILLSNKWWSGESQHDIKPNFARNAREGGCFHFCN